MAMSSNRELRIGVIGVGGRGGLAALAHNPAGGVSVVAGADPNPKVFEKFSQWAGPQAAAYDDYRKLLEQRDLDAVFITSPDFCHEEQAVAALSAGKAVFVEKPMAITIDGCDRMLAAAKASGAKLYIGHNMRHFTFVRQMKRIIDSGTIGQVKAGWCRHFIAAGGDAYFKDWHADRRYVTGLLLQKASHDIDVLHWLCGSYSRRVTAMGNLSVYNQVTDRHAPNQRGDASPHVENWPPLSQKGLNPIIDVEDLSMMLMELESGVLASYQQCHYAPDAWRNYSIIGTEGRVENFGDVPGRMVIRVWNRRTDYNPYGDQQYFIPPSAGHHGGGDEAMVEEFIRFIREDAVCTLSPIAARQSVAAGYMATWSLRHGSAPANIPPVDPALVAFFDPAPEEPAEETAKDPKAVNRSMR
jgi:predicted dehydrogenase